MTALDIQNLGKNFGQVRALRDFTLSISEGEFVSLLGPSGCGKTTTLRCVAGFEFPDHGRILFGEHDMTWMPPEQRDVGMVFQSYALFPHLTVRENLAFGLEMRKIPSTESQRRITEVLEMVQLTGMDQRFPRELSGGQQQRVALARALVIEPSLLLLDEPLANLDASLRGDMRFFIRDLQQRVGITSIYVTHDQSEAIVMSDRIVVMFDGAIAQVGTPKDIHDRPATMQVAEFVGRSNFIGGKIKGSNKDRFRRIETEYGEFVAVGPAEYKAGAHANLMIRPENIRLGKGEKDWNKLSGTVSSAIYIGDSINLEVRLSGDLSVQITARPDCSAVPGEVLDFSFPPDNCWLLA